MDRASMEYLIRYAPSIDTTFPRLMFSVLRVRSFRSASMRL